MQLPAKTACVFPFLYALFYALAAYRRADAVNTVLFFCSMLAFELSVTGLNSYVDTKTNGMPLQFARETAKRILVCLLGFAVAAALFLVARTGWVVLLCGGLCFLAGILYSWGPAPLSHMPVGEVFSGVFEGFLIPFLVVYINAPAGSLAELSLRGWTLRAELNLWGLLRLFALCVPAMLGIANIMLANNICDLQADLRVGRRTLPSYIGARGGLRLFAANYYLAFAAVAFIAALGILPPYVLAALPMLFWVQKNIKAFQKLQSKSETFPYSVRNFTLLMAALIAAAAAAAFLPF